MTFSETDLQLPARWFTGKEWADGTAERELKREYNAAVEARKRAVAKPTKPVVRPRTESKPGTPPIPAYRKYMP